MLRAEDNKFLKESGAGTPMGELLRRFWIPVRRSRARIFGDGIVEDIITALSRFKIAVRPR
jgi:phthalate 4,5-dioxygenase oxygenase subunit